MSTMPPGQDPNGVLQAILTAVEGKADYFSLLQLPRNAEPLQVRDAYFRLAKQVHPDNPTWHGNPELKAKATKAFQAITLANATLGDPVRRGVYLQGLLQAAMERQQAVQAQLQNQAHVQSSTQVQAPRPQQQPLGTAQQPLGTAQQPLGTAQQAAAAGQLRPSQPQPALQVPIRATMPVSTARPTVPQQFAIDDITGNRPPLTPRGMPTGQVSAPGAVGRPLVQNPLAQSPLTSTGQFSRGSLSGAQPLTPISGQQLGMGATDRAARPQAGTPVGNPTQPVNLSATGQFQRPTPAGQPITGSASYQTAPSQSMPVASTRGLEPPPNEEVARIYLHSGRQQLNRRDWVGAQEALDLAMPLLNGPELADCKVMLGWAIFNNNANPEQDRIERPKAMWNEVSVQYAKSQFHAQAAYYLAIWHKLHGELRHVMNNLQTCLNIQPNHIEAAREKRLMEQRRGNLAELQELEAKEKALKARRNSRTATPTSKPTPAAPAKKVALQKEPTWLEKLFGSSDKK